MSEFADEYDAAGEFGYDEPAEPVPSASLTQFAADFVAANDSAQFDLDALGRSQEILEQAYQEAPAEDVNYDDGEQTGELDPFADDFESRIGDYVDQRLASMQVLDPYARAEWQQGRAAQQAAVEQEQQAEALQRGAAIARPFLEDADAKNADMGTVLQGASMLLDQAGVTGDVIAGLSDYEREQVASQAIAQAAKSVADVGVIGHVLSRFGKGIR